MRPEQEREYVEYVSVRLPRLHRLAYLLCSDAHQADDIVQAALTSLYLNWRRASRADNLDAYVHRILVRRYLDERRRRWSRVLLGDAMPELTDGGDHSVEDREELVSALRALPKGQRAVLVLRYLGDLSVESTAEVLGCSVGNPITVAGIRLIPAGKGSRRPFGRHRLDWRWKFGPEYEDVPVLPGSAV